MAGPTLLDLPREIRDQILEEVLNDESLGDVCLTMRKLRSKNHEDSVTGNKPPKVVPLVVAHHPVLAVSKQLHDEGLDNLLRINTVKENYLLNDETGNPGFIDMLRHVGKDRAKKMSVGLMPPSRIGREPGTVLRDERCLGYLKQAEQDWNIPKGNLFYEVRYNCYYLSTRAQGFLNPRGGRNMPAIGRIERICTIRVICGDVVASLRKLDKHLQSMAVDLVGERDLDVNMKIIRRVHTEIIGTMADIWQ